LSAPFLSTHDFDLIKSALQEQGQRPDNDLDLFHTALLLSFYKRHVEQARKSVVVTLDAQKYYAHVELLTEKLKARHKDLLQAGATDNAAAQLAALKHVFADEMGYDGDHISYNDLQNTDIVSVIERRKGLPICLSILILETAQRAGFDVEGLNFPGHFILRLSYQGERLIFDPFYQCRLLQASDLRDLLKKVAGTRAELSAQFYEPASKRDILLRLQNNLKIRQIEAEDYAGALTTAEAMLCFAPQEARLQFDLGVLYAKTEQKLKAIEAFETYLRYTPSPQDRYDAQLFLQSLRDQLQ
jgi:regulator of sirC expression with transglutaminase-like and TPR domain